MNYCVVFGPEICDGRAHYLPCTSERCFVTGVCDRESDDGGPTLTARAM